MGRPDHELFIESLVSHIADMVEEYERGTNRKLFFDAEAEINKGRKLQIILKKDVE